MSRTVIGTAALDAVTGIPDGATVLVGRFGMAGMPTDADRRVDRAAQAT